MTALCGDFAVCSTHLDDGAAFPFLELFLSLLFTVGAAVGMEYYARIAHKSWWHESWMWALPDEWRTEWNKPFWKLHEVCFSEQLMCTNKPHCHGYEESVLVNKYCCHVLA